MDSYISVVIGLQSDLSLLKAELVLFKTKVDLLTLENSSLKESNACLTASNKWLVEEHRKLKEKLGLTSKNSYIPSSKELYKLKRDKVKSLRNRGGQPGHPGNSRGKLPADEVIDLPIFDPCSCGGYVAISSKPYIHQKVDLPPIKPHVIDYHVHHGRCRKCGKRYTPGLPKGVTSDTFGPSIKSVITALTGFYKNSKKEVFHILKDIFNLDMSIGSISNSEASVASKCQTAYQAIEATIRASKVLDIDETSHYNSGKLGWCWIFTTPIASLIKLTTARSRKILEKSGLNRDHPIVMSDRYAVYNYFSANNRQLCWWHIARDFERFSHSWHSGVKRLGLYLKEITGELFALHRAFLNQSIALYTFLRRMRKLRKGSCYALKAIVRLREAPHASRVAKNILKAEPMPWKFCQDPINIPLTNNLAERQIRHYVLYRKNAYFTQSQRENNFLERIISLYLTWKQQKLNPYKQLQNIIA